ncbi:hypothetical protein D7V86_24550 [bacterium D16-51]|nr:hypothetical protein D7V96_24395 [bacterium D16-59]RKI53817.1 hypothetical protein D7V86_24550 [bacterium D16-51]
MAKELFIVETNKIGGIFTLNKRMYVSFA